MSSIEIGGPTFFLQAPDSDIWGEFELPEGKRIENGDSFNLFECKFLGVLYREVRHPDRPKPNEPYSEEFLLACAQWRKDISRDDVRITMASSGFVTLLPIEE